MRRQIRPIGARYEALVEQNGLISDNRLFSGCILLRVCSEHFVVGKLLLAWLLTLRIRLSRLLNM